MTLQEVLQALGEQQAQQTLQSYWAESMASLGTATPAFLEPEHIEASREWCGLDPAARPVLLRVAQRIRQDPGLLRLAWHCSQLLYHHPDYDHLDQLPLLRQGLGDDSGPFYLLLGLAAVPLAREVHRAMGVPDEVSRATMLQIANVADQCRWITGHFGYWPNTVFWLRYHAAGRLFRLGRFEYMLGSFRGKLAAYRNRATGEVIALAAAGMRYDLEGYVARGDLDSAYEAGCWTAELHEDDAWITGAPISPLGYALHQPVTVAARDWECMLRPSDLTLDMHIPSGGAMTLEVCRDSFRQAVPFFRQFFPESSFQSISCDSWIFSAALEHLPLSSDNLVRFQRELYLFPTSSSGRDGLWHIFLQQDDEVELHQLRRDTSLRRAVADYLTAGHPFRGGGMFFLTDELDLFGTQRYRAHWPPPGLGLES